VIPDLGIREEGPVPPDLETYRKDLRALLKEALYPRAAEYERDRIFPLAVLREMGRRGLLERCIVRDHADKRVIPLDFEAFAVLIDELARTPCFGFTLGVSMHLGVFVPMLMRFGTDPARARLLAPALRGDVVGTLAATESANQGGSDIFGIETSADLAGGGIVLNGVKDYVTGVDVADHVVVLARWQPGRHFANFCALLVPTHHRGVVASLSPMAVMRSCPIGRLEFRNVQLDSAQLLGRKALGFTYFSQHLAVERLYGGVWGITLARVCLSLARAYAQTRVVGTKPLWERSAVRQRFAERAVDVATLDALVNAGLAHATREGFVDLHRANLVQAAVAPVLERTVGFCLQLFGARGLEAESFLVRALLESRAFALGGGPTETMLELVADDAEVGWEP
jgi:alkylation response protein AidB-like acyl-CoA dehydrogenase